MNDNTITDQTMQGMGAEIYKIFGGEMAKAYAATIPQEQLAAEAQRVWEKMKNDGEYSQWSRKDSTVERLIKNQIIDGLYEKIKEVLAEPQNDEALEKQARKMVEEARELANDEIVYQIAHGLRNMAFSYDNFSGTMEYMLLKELRIKKRERFEIEDAPPENVF